LPSEKYLQKFSPCLRGESVSVANDQTRFSSAFHKNLPSSTVFAQSIACFLLRPIHA
jgi:hypothetical protein